MIRIYGHSFGEGSFTQVSRGFRRAAEALGLLSGFVPVDAHCEDDPPGGSAPIAINCGSPSQVALATRMGMHRERWLMLAPNSDRIPDKMAKWLPDYVTGLLSPSAWGAEVLRANVNLPVRVCPHGIGQSYIRPDIIEAKRKTFNVTLPRQPYRVLHMTSTNAERKGTRELLDAWVHFVRRVPEARLLVVAPREGLAEQRFWVTRRSLQDSVSVVGNGELGAGAALAENIARVDLVCQPSRAEGFGLVPLEARALGVPVAATCCTGHSEHFPRSLEEGEGVGCVPIKTGPLALIDDLPRAQAPSLEPEAILDALLWAYIHEGSLFVRAVEHAAAVVDEWSWEKKTGPVLEEMCNGQACGS